MTKSRVNEEYMKKARNVLNAVSEIKGRIEWLKKQIRRASMTGSPHDLSGTGSSGTGRGQMDAMTAALEVIALKTELAEEEGRLKAIEEAIEHTGERYANFLKLHFFDGKTIEKTAELMYISERQMFRLKTKAIARFAVIYYGSKAIEGVK